MKNLLKVFFSRSFFSLYASQFLGIFNDNFFRSAFATFVVFDLISLSEKSRSLIVSLMVAVFMLPFLLFSATAGEITDKYRKDVIVKIVKILQFAVLLLAFWGFVFKNIWILLFVLFLLGILSAVLSPVKFSILPEILENEELICANSLIQAGTYLSIISGVIAGSAVYQSDRTLLFIILAAIAVLGIVAAFFLPELKPAPQQKPLEISKNIFKAAVENISFLKQSRDVYLCILGISWFWFIGVILVSQMPAFAQVALHGNESIYMFLILLFAAGIAVGALLSYFLLKSELTLKHIPISVVFMTVFIVDLALCANAVNLETSIQIKQIFTTFSGIRIIFDLFAFSVFGGLYIVPLMTMLQVVANRKIRGRVLAVNNFVNVFFMLAAAVICILFLGNLPIPTTLAFIALFNIAVAVYISILLPAHLLRTITKRFLTLFYSVNVKGFENFEKCKGGTLIIANHTSLLDAIILSTTFGEKVSFAINTDSINKILVKPFLKLIKYFAIDPTNPMVVKSIVDELKKGGIVAIFPEGRITTTGGLMKIYPGPAVIADKSNADILPVCIEGSQYSDFSYFGSKVKSRRQRKITLTVLPPRKLGIDGEIPDGQRRQIAVTKLYDIMCEMKFASSLTTDTVFDSLIKAVKLVGRNKEILDDINRTPISLGSLIGAIFAFSKLIRRKTKENEYIGLMLPNSKTTVELFFSLSAVNRIPCMINYANSVGSIIEYINNTGAKNIFTSKAFIKESALEELAVKLSDNGINVIYVEDLKKELKLSDKVFAYFMSYCPSYYYKKINGSIDSLKTAVVLYTSGAEGTPKAVALTHKNIQTNRNQISSVLDFGLMDSFFNTMPIFHSFGIVGGMFLPLLRGIKVFMYHSPLHYKIVPELVYETNSTVIFGTDTFLNGYAKSAHPYDFYFIRFVVAGVEKLREETANLWADGFGIRVFEAYGATETSSTVAVNTPMYFKAGSVGRFLPSIEYKLVETPHLEGSRLYVKGENVMSGYVKNGVLNVPMSISDGWYDTGDIVNIDEDGFVTIKDTTKRFVKIDSCNISLTELETLISSAYPQSKHAVVVVSDRKKEKQLILFTTASDITCAGLKKIFEEKTLTKMRIACRIEKLEDIPIVGTGKTDYNNLIVIAKGFLK
ncbi:MAG: MFS transporter [Endomicrobiaceae bacterium]|nr:MFS transporter [Endomicrobiaceae bacterium]